MGPYVKGVYRYKDQGYRFSAICRPTFFCLWVWKMLVTVFMVDLVGFFSVKSSIYKFICEDANLWSQIQMYDHDNIR